MDPKKLDTDRVAELISELSSKIQKQIEGWAEAYVDDVDDRVLRLIVLQTIAFYSGYSKASCENVEIGSNLIEESIKSFSASGEESYYTANGSNLNRLDLH